MPEKFKGSKCLLSWKYTLDKERVMHYYDRGCFLFCAVAHHLTEQGESTHAAFHWDREVNFSVLFPASFGKGIITRVRKWKDWEDTKTFTLQGDPKALCLGKSPKPPIVEDTRDYADPLFPVPSWDPFPLYFSPKASFNVSEFLVEENKEDSGSLKSSWSLNGETQCPPKPLRSRVLTFH